jgi:hypothetical protein
MDKEDVGWLILGYNDLKEVWDNSKGEKIWGNINFLLKFALLYLQNLLLFY